MFAGKPLACTRTLVPGPPWVGVNFTAGEAFPVAGIVAEPLEELLDELEDPDEDPPGLDDEPFEDPDEELAGAPLDELDDDPVELDDVPVELVDPEEPDDDPLDEPDDEFAGAPLDELELDPFELDEPVDPDDELAEVPLDELDDCEVDPEEVKAFDTTRSCPLLADALLEFELLDPELLELLEPELPDPELPDPELPEELLVVTATATQLADIWLFNPEGMLTCLVSWPLASVVAFITLLIGAVSIPIPICTAALAGKPPITRVACEPPDEPLELLLPVLLPCTSTAVGPSFAFGTFRRSPGWTVLFMLARSGLAVSRADAVVPFCDAIVLNVSPGLTI